MKKNKSMRLASFLLVMTLLSTSIISGTLAKYTTTDNGSDTARVAKWGVTAEVSGNLFGKDYGANSATTTADQNSIVAATSLNVHANDNVVAPGTKNETGLTVKISGTPEVAYSIAATTNSVTVEDIFLDAGTYGVMVKAEGLNAATDITKYYTLKDKTYTAATKWASGTDYYQLIDKVEVSSKYYPIKWKVAESGDGVTAVTKTADLSTIASEMVAGIIKDSRNANVASTSSYTLTWEWKFSDSHDGEDTILGDLAAGSTVVKLSGSDYTSKLTDGTDYNLDVKFGFAVTVTQVD